MESGDAPPVIFNSLYQHGVDEKRRVQIPAKWRPGEEGYQFTVMLWPVEEQGPCLRVFPPKLIVKMIEELSHMSDLERKPKLKRQLGRNSEQVALDKAGRICLPDNLAQAAGIGNQAVLIGMLDCFEIWNPERYERVNASDEVLAREAFKLME